MVLGFIAALFALAGLVIFVARARGVGSEESFDVPGRSPAKLPVSSDAEWESGSGFGDTVEIPLPSPALGDVPPELMPDADPQVPPHLGSDWPEKGEWR